jgi:alpha-glucosidase
MPQAHISAFPEGMVLYQIYPRSYKDSNGDGIGDLPGIISKLDYLQWLGVKGIWLSPFYPSPMVDFGYDVSDYKDVDPIFGSLDDFDELLAGAHQRGIKVVIDMVLNHTSERHPWFQEARSSRNNPKRDWYIWRDPGAAGGAPNNWLSAFDDSAWELDVASGQYYLHSFFKQQPDLNWRNPAVRRAAQDILHFWLKRGVDGFRMDAVYWYTKDQSFRDDPANPKYNAAHDHPYDGLLHTHSRNQPELYTYLDELASFIERERPGSFMIFEAYPLPVNDIASYLKFYKRVDASDSAPFNFTATELPWKAAAFKSFINSFETALKPGYTPIYVYGNHDQPRLASRFGKTASRAAAVLLLGLPGIAVMYYGEELGMENVKIPTAQIRDSYGKNNLRRGENRDGERTPMPWSDQVHAGFSTARPWLPIGKKYKKTNVEAEAEKQGSLLLLYRHLINLRQYSLALREGSYATAETKNPDLLAFKRIHKNEVLLILINFSKRKIRIAVDGEILLSSANKRVKTSRMQPNEGRIIKLSGGVNTRI